MPRRPHSRANSSSLREPTPPSRSSSTACRNNRRLSRRTRNISSAISRAPARPCCTVMVITSAACLLLRAQSAARTAATAGLLRGTPSPTTSSCAQRRVCRMSRPRARRTRAPRGTDTRMRGSSKCFKPAASSAQRLQDPRTASKTAAQCCPARVSGPVVIARLCEPTRRHRRARACALTCARVTPASYSWIRDTTPPWPRAILAAVRIESDMPSGCPDPNLLTPATSAPVENSRAP